MCYMLISNLVGTSLQSCYIKEVCVSADEHEIHSSLKIPKSRYSSLKIPKSRWYQSHSNPNPNSYLTGRRRRRPLPSPCCRPPPAAAAEAYGSSSATAPPRARGQPSLPRCTHVAFLGRLSNEEFGCVWCCFFGR